MASPLKQNELTLTAFLITMVLVCAFTALAGLLYHNLGWLGAVAGALAAYVLIPNLLEFILLCITVFRADHKDCEQYGDGPNSAAARAADPQEGTEHGNSR